MSSEITSIASGLDAIFKAKNPEVSTADRKQIIYLDVERLQPSRVQPRKNFDPQKLEELASSIKESGILQPLIVRKVKDRYEIVAGERRWRAARILGLATVPTILENIDDNTALAFALIENIQRENLNVVEEARTYQRLIEDLKLSHDEVGIRIGKSRPLITNYLRLLSLNAPVLEMLEADKINMGHARALLALDSENQLKLAQETIEKNLSVREVEKRVQECKLGFPEKKTNLMYHEKCEHWSKALTHKIASKVSVSLNDKGLGKVIIHVNSPEEVDWLVQNICLREENTR